MLDIDWDDGFRDDGFRTDGFRTEGVQAPARLRNTVDAPAHVEGRVDGLEASIDPNAPARRLLGDSDDDALDAEELAALESLLKRAPERVQQLAHGVLAAAQRGEDALEAEIRRLVAQGAITTDAIVALVAAHPELASQLEDLDLDFGEGSDDSDDDGDDGDDRRRRA